MKRFSLLFAMMVLAFGISSCGGSEEKPVSLSEDTVSNREEGGSRDYGKEEKDEKPQLTGVIKINEVTAEELAAYKVSGLGEKTAEKIIEFRDEKGGFKSWDDLDAAPRVGEKMLEKLKEQGVDFGEGAEAGAATVSAGDGDQAASGDALSEESSATGKESVSSGAKININTATASELTAIKGVGEKSAQRIIDYREENGLFKSIEDIMNVKGFGEKTFEKMKDQITVN